MAENPTESASLLALFMSEQTSRTLAPTDLIFVAGQLLTMHTDNFFVISNLVNNFFSRMAAVTEEAIASYSELVVELGNLGEEKKQDAIKKYGDFLASLNPFFIKGEEGDEFLPPPLSASNILTREITLWRNQVIALRERRLEMEGARVVKGCMQASLSEIFQRHAESGIGDDQAEITKIRNACLTFVRADTNYRVAAEKVLRLVDEADPAMHGRVNEIMQDLQKGLPRSGKPSFADMRVG